MRTARLMLALLALCLTTPWGRAATAQGATASVTGAVVDPSGVPIADATVTLYASTLPGGMVARQTDGSGAFGFTNLRGGRYRIGAYKQGFVPVQDGQRHHRSAGRPFALGDGETRHVRLPLPRLGVITGRVVDDRGQPLADAFVRALSTSMSAGYRRIHSKAEARTDDRGIYRLHSLWPDDYVVCASTRKTAPLGEAQRLQQQADRSRQSAALAIGTGGAAVADARAAAIEARLPPRIDPVRGYVPLCHATASGGRSTIPIGPGEERAGLDLRLADTRLARIEGRVAELVLGPDLDAWLTLLNRDEALGNVQETMRIAGEGRFRFWHVPPGRYAMVLTARSASHNPSPVRWLAAAPLVVPDDDVTGVVLEVPKRASVRGEVVLRGATGGAPGLVSRIEVRLESERHDVLTSYVGPYVASPDAAGRFEFPVVAPGSYRLSAGVRDRPPTWFPDSITLGRRDLLIDTVEVEPGQTVTGIIATLSQPRGALAGSVRTATGEPVPGAGVLVYPLDERYRGLQARRMRYAASSSDGDYVATSLRPGAYRVATLIDVAFGTWYDPEVLRELDRTAVPVSIAAGGQTVLHLRAPDR